METYWLEQEPGKLESESERIFYAWIAQRLKHDSTLNEEALRRDKTAHTMPPKRDLPRKVEAEAQRCFFNYLGQSTLFQYGDPATPKLWNILFDEYGEQYRGNAAWSAAVFLKTGVEDRHGPFADLTAEEFFVILQECEKNSRGNSHGESVMRSFCYAHSARMIVSLQKRETSDESDFS